MSGIAVIYNLDGRPVDRDLLSRMINAVPYRGPDGIHVWSDGPVGLAHAMLCTTPESLHESQPLVDNDAGLVLTLDGRVDNREELSALLTSKGYRLRDDTDAELVLRAYECWGEDSPAKIIGDFAYAIWDSRRRRLFCARDIIGVRPLYYVENHGTFLCASEVAQLLKGTGIPLIPNEGMIAEVLFDQVSTRHETLYQNVLRLAQSHRLIVNAEGVRTGAYFDLRNAPSVRYREDTEYAEHFRELMTLAVGAKLRSHGPIGINLSGGLDSSTIAAIVQSVQKRGAPNRSPFEAFFVAVTDLQADERSYVSQVGRRLKCDVHFCEPFTPDRQYCREETQQTLYLPEYPNGVYSLNLRRAQKDRGFRVVLSGNGGDELLSGSPYRFADMLGALRLSELIRELRGVARAHNADPFNYPWSAGYHFVRCGLLPTFSLLIPQKVRKRLKPLFGLDKPPSYLNREFARRVNLRERLERGHAETVCEYHSQRGICNAFAFGWNSYGLEADDLALARMGQEQRHPFFDRRLIEYCFGIPEDQRQRNGVRKFILRQGFADLLPVEVLRRQSKAEFSFTHADAVKRVEAQGAFAAIRDPVARWVNKVELGRLFGEMLSRIDRGDPASFTSASGLWCAFAVNLWYECCFGLLESEGPQSAPSVP